MTTRIQPSTTRSRLAIFGIMLSLGCLLGTNVAAAASPAAPSAEVDSPTLTDRVRLRVRTDPEDTAEIVVGQQTRLHVEVLTDTWFSQAPRYPQLTIPGAITLLPEQMGTNFTEDIDGRTFSGQRRSYVLFPQRVGLLELPSLEIRFSISQDGTAGPPLTLTTHPIQLNVAARTGVDESMAIVTTPRLSVEEEWDRSFEGLSVGDALERTIRIEGDQSLGMLLPDLAFDSPVGIAVYADAPRIVDRANRGRYRGQRTQTVTYVLTERGHFEIPAIEIQWWNPVVGELKTETLSGQSFTVNAAGLGISNRSAVAESFDDLRVLVARASIAVLTWARRHWFGLVLIVFVGIGANRLNRAFGSRARQWFTRALLRHRNSERKAFQDLDRSLRLGKPSQIVTAYWHWRDRISRPLSDGPRGDSYSKDRSSFPHWRTFEAARYAVPEADDTSFSRAALRREIREMRSIDLEEIDETERDSARRSAFRMRTSLRLNPESSSSARSRSKFSTLFSELRL